MGGALIVFQVKQSTCPVFDPIIELSTVTTPPSSYTTALEEPSGSRDNDCNRKQSPFLSIAASNSHLNREPS